jgi:hypothetical protein
MNWPLYWLSSIFGFVVQPWSMSPHRLCLIAQTIDAAADIKAAMAIITSGSSNFIVTSDSIGLHLFLFCSM